MSETPDPTKSPSPARSAPSGASTAGRNTKKILAATIAVVATLAASGAAVAVNLGASEPPLDPAAGQLTATAAATSAQRVPTETQATLAPEGTAAAAPGTPGNCVENRDLDDGHGDDRDDERADDDCNDEGDHDNDDHDNDEHENDDHHYEGADDDD